ncbi:MAG: SRPBCC domain-containing protein [Gemmatimonadetes bacterium]|nr:SRPBCC domain-containing protein [Gemmatimonadota bacterium]
MADIFHDFPINVTPARVFEAVSTPRGLDHWWTKTSSGKPVEGSEYQLFFGPKYDWRAKVTGCVTDRVFELQITRADDDWVGTRVGFEIDGGTGPTQVRFHHTGWPSLNQHYRISCFCWAMYLRILRRHLEHGEAVPYEKRLDV